MPAIDVNPTITVVAISVGEKVPETLRAHPSRYNQIAVITGSQKTKHGRAAHFNKGERRRDDLDRILSKEQGHSIPGLCDISHGCRTARDIGTASDSVSVEARPARTVRRRPRPCVGLYSRHRVVPGNRTSATSG